MFGILRRMIFTVCHAVKLTLEVFCSHGPVGRRWVDRSAILSPARWAFFRASDKNGKP